MKRSLYDGEYHRVSDRAKLKSDMRRNVEFPDDDPENRDKASAEHVRRTADEAMERLSGESDAERKRRAEIAASLDARSAEFNERMIKREFTALGLDPPQPLVSLGLLKQMGWTIQEIEGKATLVSPGKQHQRRTREDWERERNGEGT